MMPCSTLGMSCGRAGGWKGTGKSGMTALLNVHVLDLQHYSDKSLVLKEL